MGATPRAAAHRLEAEYRLLPDGRVQVESWFDLGGESAQRARVEIFRADGTRELEGRTDNRGVFTFRPTGPGEIRVVISAGAGHRKELTIRAGELTKAVHSSAEVPAAPDDVPSFADRSARTSARDIVLGVCLILAAAAFTVSWRNARRLRELERRSPSQ